MNERHIRRIRNRFILVSTLSLFGVMLLMGGLVYIFNGAALNNEVRRVMDIIIDNDGEIPEFDGAFINWAEGAPASASESMAPPTEEELDLRVEWSLKRLFGTEDLFEKSPDYIRSTVYFAVLFGPDGGVERVISKNVSDLDAEQAVRYAYFAMGKQSCFGSIGRYYYGAAERANGGRIVIYVDRTAQISVNDRILASVLTLLGTGTVLAYIFMRLLSVRIVRTEVENAEKQKRFITNASHELKTPLAVIRANTEMQEITEGETEWTSSTMRQVLRMSGLIENLVKIARADERDSIELVEIDAAAIIGETLDSFVPVAESDGKRLERSIAAPLRFVTDESMLRQLLTLLLDNAVKYCDGGGIVSCSASKDGGSLDIEVSNSFASGADTDFSRFFERFYRADSSHNTDTGGYGVGLSIAESIVGSLGGDIDVSWDDGVITFRVTLRG